MVRFTQRVLDRDRSDRDAIAAFVWRHWWVVVMVWLLFTLWVGWSIAPR